MTNPLLVGVDVHRKTNQVVLMDCRGEEVAPPFSMDNNRPGTAAFVQRIRTVAEEQGFDAIQVAAEATGWYWWHFLRTLDQDPLLREYPLTLYPFNPRLTANFRKTYSDLDKSDLLDAFVITDRLRLGRDLPQPFHYHEAYMRLRLLTRHRFHLVHHISRLKAYFLAHLYLKASEYSHLKPFGDLFGATSRSIVQGFPSIEELATIPFEHLQELIDLQGKRRFADPADNTRKLQAVVQNSYALPKALQPPVNLILQQTLQSISTLQLQLRRLDTAIAEATQPIPHTLDTIPGFGPVYSSGIIAEIGDLQSFDYDEARVAKFAGLKWRQAQSADFRAEETRLTRTGNRYLRYYFCEGANSVRMHDAEYGAYYRRKYDEVRLHPHQRAIVLTARKLVRLVVRLLTTNQPYRPRRP